jgi:hypothetical protein
MSKKKGNIFGKAVQYEKKHKGTSIGRITKRSKIKTMNKSKRQGRSKKQMRYRGQGR